MFSEEEVKRMINYNYIKGREDTLKEVQKKLDRFRIEVLKCYARLSFMDHDDFDELFKKLKEELK